MMKLRSVPTVTEKADAIAALRKIVKPGDTVYTVLRHVSHSGMSRRIDVYAMEDNRPRFITGYAGKAIGYRHDAAKGGLIVTGCGMDMGFEVVYNLGRALWPNGDGKFSRQRNGDAGPETDGGYMLRQEWI